MHTCWFVKDQSNMYSSIKNLSVGVWPCMGIRIINVVTESNYPQCNITHCMDTLCQLKKSIQHTDPLLSSLSFMRKLHCFNGLSVAFFQPPTLFHYLKSSYKMETHCDCV